MSSPSPDSIRFTDGAAYERYMGQWSRLVGTAFLEWIDCNDQPGSSELGTQCCTQSDRTLREDSNAVTRSNVAAFGTRDARRRDIGKHQDLLV